MTTTQTYAGRLSLNQATAETTSTEVMLQACARHGISQVALWRHKYVDGDVTRTRRVCDDLGITVSSVCRGGFFTGTRSKGEAEADNKAAIDEAAALGAPVLVLVCGPVTDGSTAQAQGAIVEGITDLIPHAKDAGVRLAVEPFHPMFAAERSAIVTLNQAADVLDVIGDDHVGVAVDTYHVWWDPGLDRAIARVAGRVDALHVADWIVPTPDLLAGRGLPGDGVIDLPTLIGQVVATGYDGPIEVEVLNGSVWARDADELVGDIVTRMSPLLVEAR